MFFENITLSDVDAVRLLIEYRYKYDSYFYSERDDFFSNAGEIQTINENAILTYSTLDDTIRKCSFTEEQMKIIGMMSHGVGLKDIAAQIGVSSSQIIRNRFMTICRQIVERNFWEWRKSTYTTLLELKSKKCSKCREELPATLEFYYYKDTSFEGFHSKCKRCF